MLTAPEVPRMKNGGIALCPWHQREIYFRGGFLEMLARYVSRMARFPKLRAR